MNASTSRTAKIGRIPTLRRKKPSEPTAPEPQGELQIAPFSGATDPLVAKPPFWKFHVVKFGRCMYLTTHPTLRHLHARGAPGYFVRVSKDRATVLRFEDIMTGEPLVEVTLFGDQKVSVLVHRKRAILDGEIVLQTELQTQLSRLQIELQHGLQFQNELQRPHNETPSKHIPGTQLPGAILEVVFAPVERAEPEPQPPRIIFPHSPYSARLERTPIPRELLPQTLPSLLPLPPPLPNANLLNYEGVLCDGQLWSIGAVPRVRQSRLHPKEQKLVDKHNIYLHQLFRNPAMFREWEIPPALAVFRECEALARKRVLRQFNRLLRAADQDRPAALQPEDPFLDIKYYDQKLGDGLYFDRTPPDDEPDHKHKIGWVTIYEDAKTLAVPGMFDLAVALAVAIGHERDRA